MGHVRWLLQDLTSGDRQKAKVDSSKNVPAYIRDPEVGETGHGAHT